jgi:uncharacterized coiled-coil protein SlyX
MQLKRQGLQKQATDLEKLVEKVGECEDALRAAESDADAAGKLETDVAAEVKPQIEDLRDKLVAVEAKLLKLQQNQKPVDRVAGRFGESRAPRKRPDGGSGAQEGGA